GYFFAAKNHEPDAVTEGVSRLLLGLATAAGGRLLVGCDIRDQQHIHQDDEMQKTAAADGCLPASRIRFGKEHAGTSALIRCGPPALTSVGTIPDAHFRQRFLQALDGFWSQLREAYKQTLKVSEASKVCQLFIGDRRGV